MKSTYTINSCTAVINIPNCRVNKLYTTMQHIGIKLHTVKYVVWYAELYSLPQFINNN